MSNTLNKDIRNLENKRSLNQKKISSKKQRIPVAKPGFCMDAITPPRKKKWEIES